MRGPETDARLVHSRSVGSDETAYESPAEVLRRWEDSGARWRLLARDGDMLDIALLTCAGGEQAARLSSDDPALAAFVGTRTGNGE